jgi:energy-coupling factor transporter ATP-binding protein EcfA2
MKKQAKEIEIPIKFHNYKLLKDDSFTLEGSFIYFIQGPNAVGKTSFLKALESLQSASDDTPKKVTDGESEGMYEATIPAANGEMVTIRHEFKDLDSKGRFIAILEDGTKISSVTKIRELFNYTPINIHEFFAMSNSSSGRKKQRDIILKLMSSQERDAFEKLDLQEEHHYSTRTEVNRDLSNAESSLKSITIEQEGRELLSKEKDANELLDKYDRAIDLRVENRSILNNSSDIKNDINDYEEQIKVLQNKIESRKDQLKTIEESYNKNVKELGDLNDVDVEILQEKIQKGKSIINKISEYKASEKLEKEIKEKYDLKLKESEQLTEKIDQIRTKKSAIIANSELPVENVSFEDGFLTIDGYQFKENQVCESDGVLILANILAKINPGPIQVIGDASVLDSQKLARLNQIAEQNNKVMFVDEVIRDANDMVVVGYEDMDKKTYDAKVKASKSSQKAEKKSADTKKEEPSQVEKNDSKPSGEDSKPLF